ncbi:helix-turn-helix domain-containing protein [Streptomyces fuscichromogenes]|uniref:AraC family transcriptional regulator n=1 Tax=Streptomyces fuscichromogenes TaxID=1324013 RepID=A0A917XI88_9ACTN|nr:helix-turn-helix domain-containing protein [Streptomyces fuscichromogenes]GGN28315.1 AraC family transcriptional regulator [Streptomyces fuscichromogenes]
MPAAPSPADAPGPGPGPVRDTRGIVDPAGLLSRVRFRRHPPAEPLRRHIETYWFIDWDLPEPYVSHVVPHPSVHLTFQEDGADAPPYAELTGVALGLYTRRLTGRGRVCGAKFRPGGFRPYAPGHPVSHWTGRVLRADEVLPRATPDAARAVLGPHDDAGRVAALDAFLLALAPAPDPRADHAMDLAERIRTDRTVRRVGDFAQAQGVSVRGLQRLFAEYVGITPKWAILRCRIHEALERAGKEADVDWATLAAELGYADQAHLIRDFKATVGVPPTSYATGR